MDKNEYIEIRPSYILIKVNDISDRKYEINQLLKKYCVWDKVTHSYLNFIIFVNEERNTIKIPRGVGHVEVAELFNIENVIDNSYKSFWKPQNVQFKMIVPPRSNLQIEAIKFLKEEDKYSSFKNPCKMVGLDVGKGKTYVSLNYLSSLGECALIIVDQISIVSNWRREISKLTSIRESEICVIKDSNHIKKLLKTDHKFTIFIVIHKTLQSYSQNGNLNLFFKHIRIGCKIYDEAHVEFKNTMNVECSTNVSKTLFLTATPNRSDFQENILYGKSFKYIYKFFDEHENSEHNKYHKVLYVLINSKPTMMDENRCETNHGFNQCRFFEYVEKKAYQYYLNKITKILEIAYNNKNPPMILSIIVGTLSLIDKLYDDLVKILPDKKIVRISSKIPKKEKNDIVVGNVKYDIIISTEKSFQKSLNILDLECIVNLVPMSSKIVVHQLMGRLRKNPDRNSIYVDVTDEGFQKCKLQLKYRKEKLNEKAKKTYKLNLT